jgi:hypothetical protein
MLGNNTGKLHGHLKPGKRHKTGTMLTVKIVQGGMQKFTHRPQPYPLIPNLASTAARKNNA